MIKLGLLDFDTSHAVEFTKRLNRTGIDEEQFVDGATVVIGCPGESKLSPERIPGYTEQMRKLGVPLVESPKEMIGKVDAMLIEAVDGSVHLDRARPFLEAGIPCFVDKPFACSVADAKAIAELAAKKKLPLFSSSALRYAPEITAHLADPKHGKVVGAATHGPASRHDRNPGLFHYGIHAVEMLYTILGPGCESVTCTSDAQTDAVTGHWKDGRIGTVRGTRSGPVVYGATVFAEKTTTHLAVGTKFIYRELLKKVVECFTSGKPPIEVATTIEIVAFIEAANASAANHGMVRRLAATR